MSGTRSISKTAPVTDRRWSVWKLALLLYPAVALAAWINLFMAALIGTWLGWPALPPTLAVLAGAVLGVPASVPAAQWLRRLLDRAAD